MVLTWSSADVGGRFVMGALERVSRIWLIIEIILDMRSIFALDDGDGGYDL